MSYENELKEIVLNVIFKEMILLERQEMNGFKENLNTCIKLYNHVTNFEEVQ